MTWNAYLVVMNSLPVNIDDCCLRLEAKLSTGEVLNAIRTQLNKDLERTGLMTLKLPLDQQMNWINELGNFLSSLNAESFSKLMYIIDLPESVVHHVNGVEHEHSFLAEQILKREMLKVYLRIQFAS